ncbi:MAG: hypothetical protein K2X77_04925 [Candidatus Obscuribacterales bacterium]|nr:hypothetical protein [Candidatus Obscuribacterales bacterium]
MSDSLEKTKIPQMAEASTLLSDERDALGDKLLREASLLSTGITSGFVNRASEALSHPGLTALEFGGAAGLAAGLKLMADAGGRWGKAAQAVGTAVFIAGGADIANRLIKTGSAVADNWSNPENYQANKETVGRYLGSAFFDYPLLAGASYAGIRGVEFGGSLRSRAVVPEKVSAPEILANRAAEVAAAAEARFGEIAQVVHNKLKMAQFELPSAGYQPLFAADGMAAGKAMKVDVSASKALKFEAARHPSLLAAEAFPQRSVQLEQAMQLSAPKEIHFKIPSVEMLIAQRSAAVIVPILPLSFVPREQAQIQTTANLSKPMDFKLNAGELAKIQEDQAARRISSFEILSKDNLKIDYRFQPR